MELATWNSEANRTFFCFGKSRIQRLAGHTAVIVGDNSLSLLTLLTTPSFDHFLLGCKRFNDCS